MSIEMTVTGIIGRDPELRFLPSGTAQAVFSIGKQARKKNKTTGEWENGETTWLNCVAWKELAERISECLRAKDIVIASGVLSQRSWQDRETGQKRSAMEFTVREIGPTLTRFPVQVQRVNRQQRGSQQQPAAQSEPLDPWAPQGSGSWPGDEPPF